jgi:hypothetical protein
MNRLELCVSDRCLHDSGEIVTVHECREVAKQLRNLLRGWRDELGIERAVQPAADPVLLGSHLTSGLVVNAREKGAMDVGEIRGPEGPALSA